MAFIEVRYRVDLIESERGWGQRVDDQKYFDSIEEAEEYAATFNSQNNLNYVPDWYMYAANPVMEQIHVSRPHIS